MVAPGAFASVWVFAATATESNFGLVLGWIPGLLGALLMGGLAYVAVSSVRRPLRTAAGICLALVANALYLGFLWHLMKSLG